MNEYEVFIEDINSCGGEQYAKKELIEVEADSPEKSSSYGCPRIPDTSCLWNYLYPQYGNSAW